MHDPQDMHGEVAPDEIPADAPPKASEYRDADVAGISCGHCVRFSGQDQESGICDLWEAKVAGDHVCNFYTEGTPPMNEQGDYEWDFADSEKSFAEIHLASTTDADEEGFVIKEILRTGEWNVTPSRGGKVNKALRIVKDGKSNAKDGIISLAELVENFKAGALPNVQIPLSDDNNDHKNITRLNTGYVEDVWVVDSENGSKLVAKMNFTEPDVKEKVLRGTYSDVSCGIPWAVSSRGKEYGASLEHVAITNRPFVDGLGPFLAASDEPVEDVEITHFNLEDVEEVKEPEVKEEAPIDFAFLINAGSSALKNQTNLNSGTYSVTNATFSASTSGGLYSITDSTSGTSWTVPYTLTTGTGIGSITLTDPSKWTVTDEGEEDAPVDEKSTAPRQSSVKDVLEAAQSLREIRLSEPAITKKEVSNMPTLNREELDRLDLSDEQRAAFQTILEENVELSAKARAASADERVSELEEMGFKEKPGFLKFYREVMLSDDGGPAVILLSEGETNERLTALEILDRAINSLSTDGKVNLSDQALVSGNDEAPPVDAEGEIPLEQRVADVKSALGLKTKKGDS